MQPIRIVTISRQFGAGGSDLARALGAALGWPVLDGEILKTATERLHADPAQAESMDEYVHGALAKIARDFALSVAEYAIEPAYDLDPDDVAKATHQVIRSAVKSPPLVIVGHGAQCLLAGRVDVLHVRVVGPHAKRVACVAERLSLEPVAAEAEVKRRDAQRARYLRHHFGADNNDPMLYDMQINTAHLGVETMASAIADIVSQQQSGT